MDNAVTFFDSLRKISAVSEIWKYVLVMLKDKYHAPDDLLKFLCLFFSLIDDGNLCIPLDAARLKEKWGKKLDGLDTQDVVIDSDTIIDNGIHAIQNRAVNDSLIVEDTGTANTRDNNLFVIHNGWLFTEKFFHAKQNIEDAAKSLFPTESASDKDIAQDIIQIQNRYDYTNENSQNFEMSEEQAAAIVRAKKGENLIITGGPGTGKTTVICYLLLELLSDNAMAPIYMAAPSGKAAKRMQESMRASLQRLKESEKQQRAQACQKISAIQPVTIHKLLGMSGDNTRETTKFPKNAVFVIDEASMIDAVLFSKMLSIISQSDGARIFILGDKDQIPSVQPGAVFSDLIDNRPDCLIKLTTTHRFPANSEIYKLKEYVRCQDPRLAVTVNWTENTPDNWTEELKNNQSKEYPVKYLTISDNSEIRTAIQNWHDAFYDDDEYKKVYAELDLEADNIKETLDAIWQRIEQAKILCAENHGTRGTDGINRIICNIIKSNRNLSADNEDALFVGEQIIVTQNQRHYDLSNGDIGIVVSLDNKKHLMIKRQKESPDKSDDTDNGQLIRRKHNYLFYPIYLLPTDSIQPAYAITIHKSQGSEYDNILIFLPESEKSPLLNRQILYTAITRTKNATYIVSNRICLEKAVKTDKKRDTQLFL